MHGGGRHRLREDRPVAWEGDHRVHLADGGGIGDLGVYRGGWGNTWERTQFGTLPANFLVGRSEPHLTAPGAAVEVRNVSEEGIRQPALTEAIAFVPVLHITQHTLFAAYRAKNLEYLTLTSRKEASGRRVRGPRGYGVGGRYCGVWVRWLD